MTIKDVLSIIFLSCTVIFFCLINFDNPDWLFSNYALSLGFFALTLGVASLLWMFFYRMAKDKERALFRAHLCLLPFSILLLLIPYSYFYGPISGLQPLAVLGLLLITSFIFHAILNDRFNFKFNVPVAIFIITIIYAIYFSYITVLRHLNYQDASSFDTALYSQIQWSNVHGHFFHSSTSGSNFVTHNSPFLILLTPFYALYPHPEGLIVLKTLFIASSAYPFYLILKELANAKTFLPLTLSYLFFPFLVGQNFNAPHEMCFLPPLLLFTFYFYIKNRFKSFMFFLCLSLSAKEHMALIAVMFGIYSFFFKKNKRWIVAPLLLGIAWALFSMWIIYFFQKIYHSDPYPAWLIENIKRRFLRTGHSMSQNLVWGLQTSNIGQWSNFATFYLLFAPVLLITPFFSWIWAIGLPELSINFLATIPLTYPTWHYTIVASIFMILSCVESIQGPLSNFFSLRWQLSKAKTQELLSWFLCACVLCHSFLWWDYTKFKVDHRYVADMNAAIAAVPLSSSVSLTKHLVAYVSDRKDYFLCEDSRKGEYVVLDSNEAANVCLSLIQQKNYRTVFNKDGIRVYKAI